MDGEPPIRLAVDETGRATATVPPHSRATVTAVAADGAPLGATPVPPFENDSSGLPGDTPATRVTG